MAWTSRIVQGSWWWQKFHEWNEKKSSRYHQVLLLFNFVAYEKDSRLYLLCPKGKIISKCFFGVFDFLQKTNENKSTWGIIVVKSNSFVRFLEEIEDIKNPFKIIWPLTFTLWSFVKIQIFMKIRNNFDSLCNLCKARQASRSLFAKLFFWGVLFINKFWQDSHVIMPYLHIMLGQLMNQRFTAVLA